MNFLLQSGDSGVGVEEMQAALSERDAEILRLKDALKASSAKQEDTVAQVSLKKYCTKRWPFYYQRTIPASKPLLHHDELLWCPSKFSLCSKQQQSEIHTH